MNPLDAAPLVPVRPVPRATYRLQLHREFGFPQATRALPYLAALGISHVYCSPYLKATPGSMHGYDVVDPSTINPDLGTPEDFNRFNQALRTHGLTQLLDIVPNHMGVESAENAWWQDVLRNGPTSPYAGYFDIDWSGATGVTPGKLLLPVLGAALDQVIAERQLKLSWDTSRNAFRLEYFERTLPVNAAGVARIFAAAAGAGASGSAGQLPDHAPAVAQCLDDPELVTAVAACQHYELAPWQDAATRINYRRFFDVSGLAALRIEDPAIFEVTHRQVIELVRAGIVSGLRVDHPDGLRDPATYFRRLQEAVTAGVEEDRPKGPLYIVAEKILAEGEDLPADWPVSGTTGYDFANLACGLLLDHETADGVDRAWRDFTGETTPRFGDMASAAKREVIASSFGSEMKVLSARFLKLLPEDRQDPQDLPLITTVLTEVIAAFPVYRTYPGPAATDEARKVIRQACSEASRQLADSGSDRTPALLALLEEILTGPTGDVDLSNRADAARDRERAQWAVRFQQLSAPVMAKGVEDTALYRWTRLASINDVGADPDVTGVSVEHFHQANAKRRAGWPHAMLATSTHDNKRGEYVRMRLNLISEDPAQWSRIAGAWRQQAEQLMDRAKMQRKPSASDLYLLFQTFVGTWPIMEWQSGSEAASTPTDEQMHAYGDRLKAYMTKACREAKVQTSWTAVDEAYEQAVHGLIDLVLADASLCARIREDVLPFAWYGALNSLSLTALKLTVPGVPDIYQGANVLDDSLVDPDNRRPVDFTERQTLVMELAELAGKPAEKIKAALGEWLAAGDFSRLKLWTIHRLLGWRAVHPQVFEAGEYVAVPVKGRLARHCVAYIRRNQRHGILVVATRLYGQLGFPGPQGSGSPGPWHEEVLDLAAVGIRAVNFNDILCNPINPPDATAATVTSASLAVADLLGNLPIAVLSFDVEQ
jgi:(1->4)-alpha-D-glucan 1-alpha-D-glucosylmutase